MDYTITLTPNQARIILRALENESVDDAAEFGEYSYGRCFNDTAKKLARAGFYNKRMEMNGIKKPDFSKKKMEEIKRNMIYKAIDAGEYWD